jgi:uncharacterized oxidoreductase
MQIPSKTLSGFASDIFAAAGCARDEADRVAHYLTIANLTGHPSHGVMRVPRYVAMMEKDMVRPGKSITMVTETDSIAAVDGHYGFGQTIGEQAVDLGIEKARNHGVSVISVRNVGHLGRIGDWPTRAAAQGMVSIHFVNTSGIGLLVAPFGATSRRMSTNPFAIGVPVEGEEPVILDFATSIVAEGKVNVAVDGGAKLPEGALISAEGEITTDESVIYGPITDERPLSARKGTGAIRAMGDHKGSGLSIMCELLAGALGGGGAAKEGVEMLSNGWLAIYIDSATFAAGGGFADEVADYLDFARSARPVDPDGKVLMPGDPERQRREDRLANGIPLEDTTWRSLVDVGEKLQVRAPQL